MTAEPTESLDLTVAQFDVIVRACAAYTPRTEQDGRDTLEVLTLLRREAIRWGRLK